MCNYVYPKVEPACPLCGAVPLRPAVMEVDSEVSEVQDVKGSRAPKATKRQLTAKIVATGGDIEKLREIRARYGYHPAWPARMQEIYRYAWPDKQRNM